MHYHHEELQTSEAPTNCHDSLKIMTCILLSEIHAQLDQILVDGFMTIHIGNTTQCHAQSNASGFLRPRQIIFVNLNKIINNIQMSKLFFEECSGGQNSSYSVCLVVAQRKTQLNKLLEIANDESEYRSEQLQPRELIVYKKRFGCFACL
jgi:hypothetical protein